MIDWTWKKLEQITWTYCWCCFSHVWAVCLLELKKKISAIFVCGSSVFLKVWETFSKVFLEIIVTVQICYEIHSVLIQFWKIVGIGLHQVVYRYIVEEQFQKNFIRLEKWESPLQNTWRLPPNKCIYPGVHRFCTS